MGTSLLSPESAEAASPAVAPSTITLATDRGTITAGESAKLTAQTDVNVKPSGSVVTLTDETTGAALKTCVQGTTCSFSATFSTGGPHTYVATVGSLTSNTVTVTRAAWSVDLVAADSSVVSGASTRLKATANQSVTGTNGAYAIDIFDIVDGDLLTSCVTGSVCSVDTAAMDANQVSAATYIAVVAAAGAPATVTDALDTQATSETVSVGVTRWQLTLATGANSSVAPGGHVVLTASANSSLSGTNGKYELDIVNMSSSKVVAQCSTGTVCRASVAWADAGQYGSTFVAFIADAGTATTFSDVTGIQTGSNGVQVTRRAWNLSLTTSRTEMGTGQTTRVVARAAANVGKTGGKYAIYIVDQYTGKILATCITGRVCATNDRFYKPGDTSTLREYYAVVAPVGIEHISDLTDIQSSSSWIFVDRTDWTVSMVRDDDAVVPDGQVQFTITANQDVSKTNGNYAIYWIDTDSGEVKGSCLTGPSCTITVPLDDADPHSYYAVVAGRTNPTTADNLADYQTGSAAVVTGPGYWQVTLQTDSPVFEAGTAATLTANVNHSLQNYAITVFDETTGTIVGQCSAVTECVLTTSFDSGGPHVYQAVVADASSTSFEAATNVQAESSAISITRETWSVVLTANQSEATAGQPVTFTAAANQDVGLSDGTFAIGIIDKTDDQFVASCDDGTACVATVPNLYNSDGTHKYVALIYDRSSIDPLHIPSAIEATSNVVSFTLAPWTLTLNANVPVFPTGGFGEITASANQDIASTNGSYAIYYFDQDTGAQVGVCTQVGPNSYVANMCTANVGFYDAGLHHYVAVVAAKTNPATLTDAIDVLATSNSVTVSRLPFTASQDVNKNAGFGFTELSAGANQDPWLSGGLYTIYIIDLTRDEVVSYCSPYLTCDAYIAPGDGNVYYSEVASTQGPNIDVQAESAPFYNSAAAKPASTGGSNASQSNCQCSHGDPVNTATGEFYLPSTDLSIAGTGPAIDVSRTYSSSNAATDGPFGYGWASNLTTRLKSVTPCNALDPLPRQLEVTQENGATVDFTESLGGQYVAPPWVVATLTYNSTSHRWTFVRKGVQKLVFDSDLKLISASDMHGNAIALGYNSSDQVTSVSGSGGRSISFSWNGNHITAAQDSAGRTVNYAYNGSGDLTSATSPGGAVTAYGYSAGHYMTSVTKPGGEETTNVYDSSNRITKQTDPLGRVTTFAYSGSATTTTLPTGSKTVETYANGQMVTQTLASGTPLAATTTYTYDSAGNVASVADPLGELTSYSYDLHGNVVSKTDALDRVSNWVYDSLNNPTATTDALGQRTSSVFDPAGDILSTTSQSGHASEWTYNSDGTVATSTDARGNTSTYDYDSAGRLTRTTDADGRTSSVTYDAAGLASTGTDAGGGVTTTTSNALGEVTAITNADGHTTTYAYDGAGNRTSTTDPDGHTTAQTYNADNELVTSTDADEATTMYTYTAGGQVSKVTDPDLRVTHYTYNALGELTSVEDPTGALTTYTYDAAGRKLTTALPSGATTAVAYDAAGEVKSTTDALGNITNLWYDLDGEVVESQDPLHRTTLATYTADGQIATATLPDGSVEKYDYDVDGNNTKFTDADGNVTSYAFDDASLPLDRVEPGGPTTSYAYDSAGLLHRETKPDGSTVTNTYDAAGQLIDSLSHATTTSETSYGYDSAGRLTTMIGDTGASSYTYDPAGQLTAETNGAGATENYTYDPAGELTSLTYPGGHAVAYAYDADGQMSSATDWANRTTTFGWTADGQLASQVDPNGVVQSNQYDADGQATSLATSNADGPLASFAYGYDAAGELTSSTTAHAGSLTNNTYGYDDLNQLKSVASTGSTPDTSGNFGVSAAGLVTATPTGESMSYNSAEQLTSASPSGGTQTSFSYDGNGARTSSSTVTNGDAASVTSYAYTATGSLASVATPDSTVSYTTDGNGLRASRTVGSSTKQWTWTNVGSLPLLLDDGNDSYIYGPSSTPIAQVSDSSASIQYLHADLVGSTRLITDSTGAGVGWSSYDQYGAQIAHTGTATSAIGFTGAWTDVVTALVYLRARDYDPSTAQFLSVDPAVDTTRQPYAYTANNPLLATDPTGLDAGEDAAAFGAGVLDGLTFGVSSMILGALVPGYNCLVSQDSGWFLGGQIVGTVASAVATTVLTAGAGAPLAVGEIAGRLALKGAEDVVESGVEHTVESLAEHGADDLTEHGVEDGVDEGADHSTESSRGDGGDYAARVEQKPSKIRHC